VKKKSRNNPLCKIGNVVEVDAETGEETPLEDGGLYLLPGPPGTCAWCHVAHDPAQPHNQQSLSYQMKFHAIKGRWPTWTDAMAHCAPEVKAAWRERLVETLRKHGMEIPPDLSEGV
jgi:hypothetical protein